MSGARKGFNKEGIEFKEGKEGRRKRGKGRAKHGGRSEGG